MSDAGQSVRQKRVHLAEAAPAASSGEKFARVQLITNTARLLKACIDIAASISGDTPEIPSRFRLETERLVIVSGTSVVMIQYLQEMLRQLREEGETSDVAPVDDDSEEFIHIARQHIQILDIRNQKSSPYTTYYIHLRTEGNGCIGRVVLENPRPGTFGRTRIDFSILPNHFGKGYGAEAVTAILTQIIRPNLGRELPVVEMDPSGGVQEKKLEIPLAGAWTAVNSRNAPGLHSCLSAGLKPEAVVGGGMVMYAWPTPLTSQEQFTHAELFSRDLVTQLYPFYRGKRITDLEGDEEIRTNFILILQRLLNDYPIPEGRIFSDYFDEYLAAKTEGANVNVDAVEASFNLHSQQSGVRDDPEDEQKFGHTEPGRNPGTLRRRRRGP